MTQRLLTSFCMLLLLQVQPVLSATLERQQPDCNLTSLDNVARYDLKKFNGKVLYVDFWASWCPPCVKSFPFLNELEAEYKSRGFKVIAINMDEELADAKDFLLNHPADFMVVTDASKRCAPDFDVKAMPSSYLIDRKGVIRHTQLGFRTEAAKELRVLVEQLLQEK